MSRDFTDLPTDKLADLKNKENFDRTSLRSLSQKSKNKRKKKHSLRLEKSAIVGAGASFPSASSWFPFWFSFQWFNRSCSRCKAVRAISWHSPDWATINGCWRIPPSGKHWSIPFYIYWFKCQSWLFSPCSSPFYWTIRSSSAEVSSGLPFSYRVSPRWFPTLWLWRASSPATV